MRHVAVDVPDAFLPPIDPRDLVAGDHVAIVGDSGVDDALVKILATDAEGVPLSIGHAPFSHATFAQWGAVLLSRGATVAESELAGYRDRQEAEGGCCSRLTGNPPAARRRGTIGGRSWSRRG